MFFVMGVQKVNQPLSEISQIEAFYVQIWEFLIHFSCFLLILSCFSSIFSLQIPFKTKLKPKTPFGVQFGVHEALKIKDNWW